MQGPQATLLDAGMRLHLHHGPIDLIIGAEGAAPEARQHAFEAAHARFQTLLEGLVVDLPKHRQALSASSPLPADPVAQRMVRAATPFCSEVFLTPMIAVAGAVADEVLSAMCAATELRRAYVNNGGDIAVHLAQDAEFSVAMAQADQRDLGRIRFCGRDGIGGIATSGAQGRSHSLGIADSVTVLAQSAAAADAAATLIANAIDLPDHSGISRQAANTLQPDSDLGARLVVTGVPRLGEKECEAALDAGLNLARAYLGDNRIKGAALFLQGRCRTIGQGFDRINQPSELEHA